MNLARVNNILLIAIIVINLFIFCMPFLPAVSFWVKQKNGNITVQLNEQINSDDNIPQDNRLIVPKIMLNEQIFEGDTKSTLNKGLWHQPNGVAPGQPGATIIAGHRFTYDDPEGSFYHLDKLETGDQIGLYWNGQKHLYSITDKSVVGADHQITSSGSEQLVLYTCTPIWNPAQRLIITAQPYGAQGDL